MLSIFHQRIVSGIIAGTLLAATVLRAEDAPRPEEVVPVGPGYITKGYKTMINGQVVQTTDGRTYDVEDVASMQPADQQTTPAAPTAPAPTAGSSQVVTMIDGVLVDPETKQPIQNVPENVELIPLGMRKISTDVIGPDGQSTRSESMAPYFRLTTNAEPGSTNQTPEANQHPASMGPDFSGLLAAQDDAAETGSETTEPTEAETEEESKGGLFDFLFGKDEPEETELVINTDKPLTQAEMEALKNDPKFQQYLKEQADDTTRNFYSGKRRGKSVTTEKAPEKIVIEAFNPDDWIEKKPVPPTPNIAIGKLVSVDLNREIAVCWLQTRYIRANFPLITRNYELETTSVLLPSGQQDGRAAGFWIAEGTPSPGDEVIVPGPEYQKLINPWLQPR